MPEPRKPEVNADEAAAKAVNAAVPAGMLDPATLQVLMATIAQSFAQALATNNESNRQMFLEGIAALREPTPAEKDKMEKEIERVRMARLQAAENGKQIAAMEAQNQRICQHLKPNGMHTFGGQILSNGWARIACQRCGVAVLVKPLPEHMQSGLQLENTRGLTLEHLKAWEANSARIDAQLRAQADAAARANQQYTEGLADLTRA